MNHKILASMFLSLTLFFTTQLASANQDAEVKAGAAVWGLLDQADRQAFHLAYIHNPVAEWYGVRPTILVIWAENEHHYFSAGLVKQVWQQGRWSANIAFHAGVIDSSEELGDTIEFYSMVSGRYQIDPTWAVEAEVGHISNGGLGDTNPGSESFVLSLTKAF